MFCVKDKSVLVVDFFPTPFDQLKWQESWPNGIYFDDGEVHAVIILGAR